MRRRQMVQMQQQKPAQAMPVNQISTGTYQGGLGRMSSAPMRLGGMAEAAKKAPLLKKKSFMPKPKKSKGATYT